MEHVYGWNLGGDAETALAGVAQEVTVAGADVHAARHMGLDMGHTVSVVGDRYPDLQGPNWAWDFEEDMCKVCMAGMQQSMPADSAVPVPGADNRMGTGVRMQVPFQAPVQDHKVLLEEVRRGMRI
jgi:hypothetical protein